MAGPPAVLVGFNTGFRQTLLPLGPRRHSQDWYIFCRHGYVGSLGLLGSSGAARFRMVPKQTQHPDHPYTANDEAILTSSYLAPAGIWPIDSED